MSENKEPKVMIESLTPEQEQLMEVWKDRFLEIGLATGPANMEEVRVHLAASYKQQDLTPPKYFINVPCPYTGNFVASVFSSKAVDSLPEEMEKTGNFKLLVECAMKFLFKKQKKFPKQKWFETVITELKTSDRHQYNSCMYGNQDSYWLGFYSYFQEVLKLTGLEKINPLIELAKNSGWVWVGEDVAIVCDRPDRPVLFNAALQCHGNGEAALHFSSGFEVFIWNGTIIPDRMGKVKSQDWDPKWLLDEKDQEIRRILIAGIGYDVISDRLDAKIIHEETIQLPRPILSEPEWDSRLEAFVSKDEVVGIEYVDSPMELIEVVGDIDVEPIRLLKVICPSTESTYCLRVPPTVNNCSEARNWTLFKNPDFKWDVES